MNKDRLTSPFPICTPYVPFCHTVLARTSQIKLNRSRGREHPCLVPDFSEKASSFSPLTMMLGVGFLVDIVELRQFPSILSFPGVFIMDRCWTLSSDFPASPDVIILTSLL